MTLQGTYAQRLPFVSVSPADVKYLQPVIPHLLHPPPSARQPEILSVHHEDSIHQVLQLLSIVTSPMLPTAAECRIGIFHLFHETLDDDLTHDKMWHF
jgi:hypothetical protein